MEATAPHGGTEANGVAGSIKPGRSTLSEAIEAWAAYLRGRHKKKSSIGAMTSELRRAAKARGWASPTDLTFSAVTEWLGSHDWAPSTYNRNLSVFRSFTSWAAAAEVIPSDPLKLAQRADGHGGPGSRAATLADARAIVRTAWLQEQTDSRSRKSPRSIYYLCLFLAGCRKAEPLEWRWSDLHLDESIPAITWRPEMHKAGRREEVPLAPELADALRAWRAVSDTSGPVFLHGLGKHQFNKDRDRAGIPAMDSRQRALTAHSARKFLSTTLHQAGVHARLIDRLMRHAGGTEARYYDPSMAEMAEALGLVEKIFTLEPITPQALALCGVRSVPKSAGLGVDACAEIPMIPVATPNERHDVINALPNTQPPAGSTVPGVATASAVPARGSVLGSGAERNPTAFAVESHNGDLGTGNAGGSLGDSPTNRVADVLEAVARLIREEGSR